MAVYPLYSAIPYNNPLTIENEFKTLTSNFNEFGEEKRKRKWLYPKRNILLKYESLTKADAAVIWDFYIARSGSYQAFNFFVEYGIATSHTGEYIATGDATTSGFNLPSKNASSRSVYINTVEQTDGSDYNYTATGGADDADLVEFVVPPTLGSRITYDFTGTLKISCRFKEDIQSFDIFYNALVNVGIQLKGLLNS